MIKVIALALLTFQTTDDTMKGIEAAMKTGNAKELVKFFGETVELKIDGSSANYSKNQSEVVLRKFFQRNPVRGFYYIHKGSSDSEGMKYSIGKYEISQGSYRMMMLLKKSDDGYYIDMLNFTKE